MILKIPQFIFLLPDIQDFDLENLDSIPITDLIFHQTGRFEKYRKTVNVSVWPVLNEL